MNILNSVNHIKILNLVVEPKTITNRFLFYNFDNHNLTNKTVIDNWGSVDGTYTINSVITNTRAKNGTYSMEALSGWTGSSDFVTMPTGRSYTASNGLSFSFWFYHLNDSPPAPTMCDYVSGDIKFVAKQNGATWVFANSAESPSSGLNAWHHACVTIANNDSYTAGYAAYHNGVLFDTGIITALNGTLPLGKIGDSYQYGEYSMKGNIDEFRIYNKVLTQSEITGLYLNNNTYI